MFDDKDQNTMADTGSADTLNDLDYEDFDIDKNMEATRQQARLRRKRLWRKYRSLLWLLLLVPLVYFVVQIFIIMAPRMRYETAMQHTMTDSLTVTGQVVLNSQPIYGAQGYPYYTVPTGQRVAAGAEVALVFRDEKSVQAMDNLHAVNEELEQLEAAQQTVADGGDMESLLGDLQNGLYGVLDSIQGDNYSALDQYKYAMALASNKMQVATGEATDFGAHIAHLERLKAEYESLTEPTATVTSPEVGFFVPSSMYDAIPMDMDTIAALTPQQLAQALQREPEYYGNDVTGHIVSDFKWHYYVSVTAKEAEKFKVGAKNVQLSFPDVGNIMVPVQVESVTVDEENDVASVALYCEYVSPDVLKLRVENAEIVFGTHKGLRISKSALRLVDVTNEDGSVNTYQGVYIEFGNMVYFKRVEIILEDDFYMMVSPDYKEGVNEVKMYDKVIIDSGGVELYDEKIL